MGNVEGLAWPIGASLSGHPRGLPQVDFATCFWRILQIAAAARANERLVGVVESPIGLVLGPAALRLRRSGWAYRAAHAEVNATG